MSEQKKHTRESLAAMIDHTLLRPVATPCEIERLCEEALRYGFASVCVNPCHVPLAARLLKGAKSAVCTVVGFPLGANMSVIKGEETRLAVEQGAQEIDMVLNVGLLKGGDFEAVREDIRCVVNAAQGKMVKVILETCFLTDEEKIRACTLSLEAGAQFVKTSTGFGSGGATVEDVQLMRKTVGERSGVKASGGVKSLADARAMIEAGANRLGTSSGVAIVEALGDE